MPVAHRATYPLNFAACPRITARALRLSAVLCSLRLDVLEHGPVDHTVRVVGQRAGLQADDVLALDRPQNGEVRRLDDELAEDLVSILPALRVLEIDLVALFQILEIIEG